MHTPRYRAPSPFDSRIPRAYPNQYVLLLHRLCDVLLLPVAGVWVET